MNHRALRKQSIFIAVVLLFAAASHAQRPALPDAAQSDPVALGYMVGSPPAADKIIRSADGSSYRFPQLRWTFSHVRQLSPTSPVSTRLAPVQPLPRALRDDIDGLTFMPLGKTEPMTWRQSFDANYTDGIVVLHKGRVVYERYAGALQPYGQHLAQSVTKSVIGMLAAALVVEGKLDDKAMVTKYIPELKDSAYGDATVRDVMDMRIGVKYSENYADPKAEIWDFARSGNLLPRGPNYSGPKSFYDFLKELKKEGPHGAGFAYKTVNAEVLGWLVRRATGQNVPDLLSERVWQHIGAEQDAYYTMDDTGTAFNGGGFNAGLRDFARIGELMRLQGNWKGKQIIPAAAVQDIARGGDKAAFATAGFQATLPGWSYRSMWWVSHNANGAYMARGIHGQAIYIDPKAEMVIARFASNPIAGNPANDPITLPAFQAVADRLVSQPR